VSALEASLDVLKAASARLESQVASLRSEAAALRANISVLEAADSQLASNSTDCSYSLEAAVSRAFGLEAGLIFVVVWLALEHVARPVWVKYRKEAFPIDR